MTSTVGNANIINVIHVTSSRTTLELLRAIAIKL